ncbi:MAG: sensor histidine kinase [Actinophytocola sp.]|uniref:sensor histidine kinase n=1 Tax=Actinophytocola sp. TaxID=1872138 RepID=UPI0013243174|nr:sensor histidine kinase [Actinophytocola sp.]MPZ82379.1 sensor histidine kinase [Actinophytocola sp.]
MAGMITRLRVPVRVQDVLLAGFVTLFHVRGTDFVVPDDGMAALSEPFQLGWVLLVAGGLVLLVRRRWPVAVFVAVVVISAAYYVLGYPDGPGWVGLFVATYTLTARGEGESSLRLVAVGLGGLTVVWLATADLVPLTGAGWVFFRIGAAVMAAALGESVRARRELAARVVERALERAERAEQTREVEARGRVDAERLRIAREVHDTVAHAIAIINVHAGVGAHVLDKRPERARESLAAIEQTSAQALHELRATLQMLRADTEADQRVPVPGLDQLDQLVRLARDAGLTVTVEVTGRGGGREREVAGMVDRAAYGLVQEAITNAIRHAGPATVTITLTYEPDALDIEIVDDGAGSPGGILPDRATGGRGILGMRERCHLLGGDFAAGPRPGGGFRVHARLPVAPDPAVH